MSASAMVETYDMPMIDYNEDGDIPMGGSSSENWFQPLPHMDEDVLHAGPFSDSQEIDMMAFEETTTEYEMTDEAAQPHDAAVDTHAFDAEVYDVTTHPSPEPSGPGGIAQNQPVQPENFVGNGVGINVEAQFGDASHSTLSTDSASVVAQQFVASESVLPRDVSTVPDNFHAEHASDSSAVETYEQRGEGVATEAASLLVQPPAEVASTADSRSSLPPGHAVTLLLSDNTTGEVVSEADTGLPSAQIDNTSLHENEGEISSERGGDEESPHAPQTTAEGAGSDHENAGPSETNITQQVYVQPPPPIFLSLQVASAEGDQPEFVLFNYPDSSSHTTEEPLLLLQHRPSLFYEPVSAVFDAFRQEEYFSHLEELSEAEMALNAYELQLVISEDNIYSREVSLQDLHAMHQGVGLPGQLRLTLQSIVPRFITRYNHLRDQITRLVLGEESGEARQHEISVGDEGDVDEQQVHPAPDETYEDRDQRNEAEGQGDAVENGGDEVAEHLQQVATGGSSVRSDELAGHPAHESGDIGENAAGAVAEGAEDNVNEVSEHDEDAAGETDDAVYVDNAHAQADEEGAESPSDEHDTEYAHEVEPHEEGDEGHGDDFQEDGGDGTDTVGDADEATAFPEGTDLEAHTSESQHESEQEPDEAETGQLSVSHSTSTSSFDADESSWEEAAGENDEVENAEGETNQSIQQTTTVFDEEGNLTDPAAEVAEEFDEELGDEFGDDDFGDEDFEESAEGTLEDPNEEPEKLEEIVEHPDDVQEDADAASREVLAESENFVSKLENEIDATDTKEKTLPGECDAGQNCDDPSAVDAPPEPDSAQKNTSKRSLDDAELDEVEEAASTSSSPDSKRTRTL